ncbi:hypothetical protein SSCG_05868 [Streptomyces clavuligerus]|nr:hypothetical protein SSCG_05868 [Streptomyces clavuligerus]
MFCNTGSGDTTVPGPGRAVAFTTPGTRTGPSSGSRGSRPAGTG